MRLTSAGLSVDEERAVEAVQNVVHQRKRAFLEDLVLRAILTENPAEFEFTRLFSLLNVKRDLLRKRAWLVLCDFYAAEVLAVCPLVLGAIRR